jgi:arsenate reductase
LQILNSAEIEFEIIDYMKNPISEDELKNVIHKLEIKPEDLLRKGETIFKELYKGKELSDEAWIKAMIEHPKLMERPIVIKGNKATIGRPPENVKALLS